MGFLADRKERKEARRQEEAAAAQRRQEEEERQRREAERQRILDELEIARDPAGVFDERSQDLPIIPKKGEEVIGMISGTGLVEVKAGRVQYRGGSAGTSVRVMKGVSVRVGQHKGTAYREPEMPRLLCSGGTLVITNQRAVYAGPKHTRDFHWAKLMAVTASSGEGGPCLLLPVENRQKTSGVLVGDQMEWVAQRCEVGLAIQRGTLPELIEELEQELAAL